jgi:hypothetical protein
MLLLEFFEFNNENNDFSKDRRYDNANDKSVVNRSDTRKIRLTLKQINMMRMQSEAHETEKDSESGFIKQMYGAKPPEPGLE